MSFHSQLWSKDPHVLSTYITKKGFQHVCSTEGRCLQLAHTGAVHLVSVEAVNARRNHCPGATSLHTTWKAKPEEHQATASLVNSNSPLLPATQKRLHEDYLSKFSVAGTEAPLKIDLAQNRDVYEITFSPFMGKKRTSIWFAPTQRLEEVLMSMNYSSEPIPVGATPKGMLSIMTLHQY